MTPAARDAAIAALKAKRDRMEVDRLADPRHNTPALRAAVASLNHDLERANNQEVCVQCIIHYDSAGAIQGAQHYRLPLDDVVIKVAGLPDRVIPGLKSRFTSGSATLDAQGNLALDGQPV